MRSIFEGKLKLVSKRRWYFFKEKYVLFCTFIIIVILLSFFVTFVLRSSSKQHQDFYDNQNEVLADKLLKSSISQTEWSNLSCQERLSFLERLIVLNYVPKIKEAVDNYYKELRGFNLVGITDVKVVAPYEYEIKIQISTYVGAHNPPYGLDDVTIHFSKLCDGEVVNFEHKDE